jgi:hypothetical protein
LRELQFKKSNYGPISNSIVLRYKNGLFLPERGLSNIDKAAREAKVEEIFILVGKKIIERGEELSPHQTSHSYAPSLVAKDPGAAGYKKAEFVDALARLIDRKIARVETLKPGTSREKKTALFQG